MSRYDPCEAGHSDHERAERVRRTCVFFLLSCLRSHHETQYVPPFSYGEIARAYCEGYYLSFVFVVF